MKLPRFGPIGLVALLLVAAAAARSAAPESQAERTTEHSVLDEPRKLIEEGDYIGAEALARELLQTTEASHGETSLEVADILEILVEALWRGGKVQDAETRSSAERAVRIIEEVSGPESSELSSSLNELGNVLQALGEYEEAIVVFERGLAIDETHLGPEHANVATKLFNIGNAHKSLGNYDAATAAYERSLAIYEKMSGPEHSGIAFPLSGLGAVHSKLGDFETARGFYERALSIWETAHGPNHPRLAQALLHLGNTCNSQGNYDEARTFYERALSISEKAHGPDHADVASALIGLANTSMNAGQLEEARLLYERAISIRERAFGPDHPLVAGILTNLGWLLPQMSEHKEARLALERALKINERSLGLEHPDLVPTLVNLGIVNVAMGSPSNAISYFERGLEIAEEVYGPDDWRVGATLGNLAFTIRNTGDFIRARQMLQRALQIFEHSQAEPARVVWILDLLGAVQSSIGDYVDAKRYFGRALETYEKQYGPDHPKLAVYLGHLAWAHQAAGESAAALETLERALAICESASGPGAGCAAGHLEDMADVIWGTGDLEGARSYLERAQAIHEEAGPGVHRRFHTLSAELCRAEGRLAEAQEIYDRVLEDVEQKFSPGHQVLGNVLAGMAQLYIERGEFEDAFDVALRAEQIGRDYMTTNARGLSEREALRFSSQRPGGLDALLSVAVLDPTPEHTRDALDSLVQSRALVLDEMAERRRVTSIARENPDTARLVKQYADASERLAYLTIRGNGNKPEQHLKLLEDTRREREETERALGELSIRFRAGMSRSRLNLRDVYDALPKEAVLVAYVRYDQYLPKPDTQAEALPEAPPDPVPTFAAFVLRQGQNAPAFLRLAEAATVDSLTTRWGQEAAHGATAPGWSPADAERAYRIAGIALRETIWDPIAPLLDDASIVLVVPDGSLHQIDLASLPIGDRHYLVEEGPLVHYLSASRDLVPIESPMAKGKGLLAIGAPEFDKPSAARTPEQGEESGLLEKIAALSPFRGERSGCGDFESLTFAPLPASREEVQEIAALWKRGRDDADAVVLTGAEASEAAFKAGAPGKRAVHVATHGFFLGGRCPSAVGHGTRRRSEKNPPPLSGENPLLLSGLALAGANRRAAAGEHEEDGIITAEEIAALDLTGVELAVLSACDTGVGQVKAGEGIFGLRRAFRVAGVGTLIVSLWPVEDQAVQGWMSVLYRKRFIDGLSTAESMRATSLEILQERREEKLSTHPSHWAGFVATGDWR